MSLYSPEPNSSESMQLKFIRIVYLGTDSAWTFYKPSKLKANFFSSDAFENNVLYRLKKYTSFTYLHLNVNVFILIWWENCWKVVD